MKLDYEYTYARLLILQKVIRFKIQFQLIKKILK